MAANEPKVLKADKELRAFVQEVTATLLKGHSHKTPGLGTFSTCTRKATATRDACTIAMFRASAELRDHVANGPPPTVSGPHAGVVRSIIDAMQAEHGVEVPLLGRMAVVPVPGKNPKLVFQGARELNHALSG